jgi:hypothetical protein
MPVDTVKPLAMSRGMKAKLLYWRCISGRLCRAPQSGVFHRPFLPFAGSVTSGCTKRRMPQVLLHRSQAHTGCNRMEAMGMPQPMRARFDQVLRGQWVCLLHFPGARAEEVFELVMQGGCADAS